MSREGKCNFKTGADDSGEVGLVREKIECVLDCSCLGPCFVVQSLLLRHARRRGAKLDKTMI